MDRGKMPSTGRGGKSKVPQHPQDIFALGTKSTVVVSRDSEKRNIHKPSTSGVERKREPTSFGPQPPSKRPRIGSPAEAVSGTSLEVDPVDLVPNVLQALDTLNSDKLLGLLTGSIRLLKSQRAKPDPILCMSMLYLTKIRPNMFAHEAVTQSLCTLLKREQGAAFKNKGNPLVFVLACNMLYAGHRDSSNWPDTFIKVYIEDALNERWWVECSWCKCLVENIVTAFGTKLPPPHLIPSDTALGTMSPSGSGSPLMGSNDDDPDNNDLEYTVFPRYATTYDAVEALVVEAIKDQIQRRSAAPDAFGKGFLKLLSATCGIPEIRSTAAPRLEAWLHSGKLGRYAQELLAHVCCNCGAAPRDHEVLAQLARMRLKTKPLQTAYQSCLREMVSDSPALLRSVVTHTIYNELSAVRSPNNMAVLAALIHAQPQLVPAAMAETFLEFLWRPEDYLRALRALTRECVRAGRGDAHAGGRGDGHASGRGDAHACAALVPLARALAAHPPAPAAVADLPMEIRERAFSSLVDLFCCCCLVTASHSKHLAEWRAQLCAVQAAALGWLLDTAAPLYRPSRHDFQHALNKIMFVEPVETYTKADNWPPESERALVYRLCCEAPLPQNTLLRVIFIGLSKEIPVAPTEVFELVEQLVRRACGLPPEDGPLQVDKLEVAEYIFQLCQFHPPENITLPAGYTPPPLAITSLYWRGWVVLTLLAAHNPQQFAERAAATYPTLRALIEMCITNSKQSIEWSTAAETERPEAEKVAILQLETHLAAASNAKLAITEQTSRLLSQLTTLEPLGPARKPPAATVEALHALNTAMRLGKLLCRQPALLLELVDRHGTRRAMPWLHQLLRQDQLELSVLPVQCLCEFLCAGGAGGAAGAGGEAGKAGELCAHLRRTVQASAEGARAVLHYYLQRLAHAHAPTRASAARGLKLVLSQPEDTTELDLNADVNPEEWLEAVWSLRHWAGVGPEVAARVRAACLVECVPRHVAAYIAFLAAYTAAHPDDDHSDIVLDLSQVVMERTSVVNGVLGAGDQPDERQQRALLHLTQILYRHLHQVRNGTIDTGAGSSTWSCGERVTLQWPGGRQATLSVLVAHAHLKLLCYGPSIYDTNQEMYSWLVSVWVGAEAPAAPLEPAEEAALLPDWLRLHLVRSARPALLEAGLRALPAHKLALFIQTFGMPVAAMSALLAALDACPAGAVVRLGVERGYMAQLLRVQRARGATGGEAFAAALRLQPPQYPPDDDLFAQEELPQEAEDEWGSIPEARPLPLEQVPALLATAFGGATTFCGDLDTAFTQLVAVVSQEACLGGGRYVRAALGALGAQAEAGGGAGLLRRGAHAVALLRALTVLQPDKHVAQLADSLVSQCKGLAGPVVEVLRSMAQGSHTKRELRPDLPFVPARATKQQLINAFESATPSTLEAIGNKIIETQDTALVVDVISHLLEKNQEGYYETPIKTEDDTEALVHVFARRGLGCGLLLDWLSELQRETLGTHPQRQMQLMFVAGGAEWRPLLVTLLAHRASWRTLHSCLAALLNDHRGWSPSAVLEFAQTVMTSPRVWQGRDKATPKHHVPDDTLRLTHHQLGVLVRYIVAEGEEAGDEEGVRRRMEARLPLVLRCCSSPAALLACALAARDHPVLLQLLYMKVPRIMQLVEGSCELGTGRLALRGAGSLGAFTSATDRVAHVLLTALHHHQPHHKDQQHKVWRLEAGARAVFARVQGAGARALALVGALLRGPPPSARLHLHLLAAIEVLPDDDLFSQPHCDEMHGILECLVGMVRGGGGAGGACALAHRVAGLLRRYLGARPARAAALLHAHRDTVASVPALSALQTEAAPPASAAPPPLALLALQRRADPPDALLWALQEMEAWGSRRGGAWGGARAADGVLRAAAPLAASPHAALRAAALGLLARLLPAVPDTTPGLEAILECLDSNLPDVAAAAVDKLPELIAGMQEHAARLLAHVFQLGITSRLPVEQSLAKCVATINLHRGC